jgi:two-component system OmpR family sensor kinase
MPSVELDHPLAEMVARTLRHEVGDLLQSLYAASALLQALLPPAQQRERRLIQELRQRGEVCRRELDAIYDLICPLRLELGPFDLARLVGELIAAAQTRSSARIETTAPASLEVTADARRVRLLLDMVLAAACQAAHERVKVLLTFEDRFAECTITDDGPGAGPDLLLWLERPFAHTREARAGLGLALARRVLTAHGGGASAANVPEGGCRVRLWLPCEGPPEVVENGRGT